MARAEERPNIQRMLVVIPNWVGDVVLATPILAALRAHFQHAHITYLMRRYVGEIVAGGGWHDDELYWPSKSTKNGSRGRLFSTLGRGEQPVDGGGQPPSAAILPTVIRTTLRLVRELRERRFDLALLLTNSFRSALVCALARIPRRVGYAREGRGWLLTERLRPLKRYGRFVPSPVGPYYAALAEHIGCRVDDMKLRLGITPEQEAAGAALQRQYGLDAGRPYAVVNPGAAFGAAKCWPAERFAELCDRLNEQDGLLPVLIGAPGEMPLLRRIAERTRARVVLCDNPGTTLGSLKALVREAKLLVCNDTGPRHYGNAFNVPTVTLFGPTFQEWTDTGYAGEMKLQEQVECGPCQLRTCPLDHRCMTQLTTQRVHAAARALTVGGGLSSARSPA